MICLEPTPAEAPVNAGRLVGFDWLKLLACFAVVVIHTQSWLTFAGRPASVSGAVIVVLFRLAVPVFFACSGFLLVRRSHETRPALSHAAQRIGSVYLAACVLYALAPALGAALLRHDPSFATSSWRDLAATATQAPVRFVFSGTWHHLWFFPNLLAGLSVLHLAVALKKVALLLPLAGAAWIGVIWFLPLLGAPIASSSAYFVLRALLFAIVFTALGGALALGKLPATPSPFWLIAVGLPGLALEATILARATGAPIETLDQFAALVPLTAAVVGCAATVQATWGARASRPTLGIFILHPLFLLALHRVIDPAGPAAAFVFPLLVFASTFLAAWVLAQWRVTRWFVV